MYYIYVYNIFSCLSSASDWLRMCVLFSRVSFFSLTDDNDGTTQPSK